MGRSGSYYDDFQRYGRRSQYDYRRYLPSYRESDEERAIRKADERRAYEERRRREQERHDLPHRDDDTQKRKSHDERGTSHIDDSSSKRARLTEETTPSASKHVPAQSPAPVRSDIQAIINRPAYQVGQGPPTLQSRFPQWCLRGVRFDLDLVPLDKSAMVRNLDTVRTDIERMSNWQKLVDELQRVNRANPEAMLTMENDKAELQKTLEQHDAEMRSISSYNEKLEAEVEKLKEELATSSTSYSQKESMLQQQVRDAHASQRAVEDKLTHKEKVIEEYRVETLQLREQTSSQSLEIEMLKA